MSNNPKDAVVDLSKMLKSNPKDEMMILEKYDKLKKQLKNIDCTEEDSMKHAKLVLKKLGEFTTEELHTIARYITK